MTIRIEKQEPDFYRLSNDERDWMPLTAQDLLDVMEYGLSYARTLSAEARRAIAEHNRKAALMREEDMRAAAKRQESYKRASQFLLECTEEGEGFHVSYITLKHHYFSWCESRGLPEFGFGELYHVLVERGLVQYDQSTEKTTCVGIRMKHPVGRRSYYNKNRKGLSRKGKQAAYAKLHSKGNVCALCGQPILPEDPVHIDHVLRVRQGGSEDPDNLQVVHAKCNLTKG